MLKNPTTSIIAIIVIAVIVVCIYIVNTKATPPPVTTTEPTPVEVIAPVDNSVETVVTPVEATPVLPAE